MAKSKKITNWDQYVADTVGDVELFELPLPGRDEPVKIPCPSSKKMQVLNAAQLRGDSTGMVVAAFGPELAAEVLDATDDLPFTVRQRIVNDLTMHYGLSLANLGDSVASSD